MGSFTSPVAGFLGIDVDEFWALTMEYNRRMKVISAGCFVIFWFLF
jgi:hypothetical protein